MSLGKEMEECVGVSSGRDHVARVSVCECCVYYTSLLSSVIVEEEVERCFFGSWGEFGPCTNGVVTKNRQVLQGDVECERKAVITQACSKQPGS
ncbi:hypothetical protein Btru_039746 [Bulinus truncatus]|nr:hypothetical protein Btru_039746 [Bulinus truncatus]